MRPLLLALLWCGAGCGRVTTTDMPLTLCPRFVPSCRTADVPAMTELAPDTRLTRAECDVACSSLMCPNEEKTCAVVATPLGGRAVRCVSAFLTGRDPICPQGAPTP